MAFESLEKLIQKSGLKKSFVAKKFKITSPVMSVFITSESAYLKIREYLLKNKVDEVK